MRIKFTLIILVFVFLLPLVPVAGSAQGRGIPAGRKPYQTAGGKLLATPTYELYAQVFYNETAPCLGSSDDRHVAVSLVFDVDENFVVTNDEAYRTKFEREILPAINQLCGPVRWVQLNHYYKAVKFDFEGSKFRESHRGSQPFPSQERAFTTIEAQVDSSGKISVQQAEACGFLRETTALRNYPLPSLLTRSGRHSRSGLA